MTKNYRNLIWKGFSVFATLALLWRFYPTLASITALVAGLCLMAYWGSTSKLRAAPEDSGFEDFRRRLARVESRTTDPSPRAETHGAFGPSVLRTAGSASAAILGAAISFYAVGLPKAVAIILLLLSLFWIARQGVMWACVAGSALAAVMLSLLFLPPLGSIRIASQADQLTLILFVLAAMIGSALICGQKTRGLL